MKKVLDEDVNIDDAIMSYIVEYQKTGLEKKVAQMNNRFN